MNINIYHQSIKDLAAANPAPRILEAVTNKATLNNALCGDKITVALQLEQNTIVALTHKVNGCLLCKAAANIIANAAINCTVTEFLLISKQLTDNLTGKTDQWTWSKQWQPLALFKPVSKHKSRHNCVLLSFQAVNKACDSS